MQYPIRVLHTVVNMNRGGAETLIMNIYRNIDRAMVQFDFLVHKDEGAYEEEIIALGGRIYRIPYVSDVGHFGYIKKLKRFFMEHSDYEIVHAHMDCMSGLVLEAAKNAGIPVRISHSHNTQSEGSILVRMYKHYIKKKIVPSATNILACSDIAASWLFGKKIDRVLIIKNGVDVKKFSYSDEIRQKKRKEIGISEKCIVAGHVGRFYHQKNHTFLLDIFSEMKKRNANSLLLLVGDGPLKQDIEKKATKLNIRDSVVFLGIRSDVEEVLQAMDVFVFPSHHEGLGLTVIEAQAERINCIVSDAVPSSADIGVGLITFISLKADINKWVKEIVKPYARNIKPDMYLKRSGYDISYTAKGILNFYLSTIDKQISQNEEV